MQLHERIQQHTGEVTPVQREALAVELEEAYKMLEVIADMDFRGNREASSVAAHRFLQSVGRRA